MSASRTEQDLVSYTADRNRNAIFPLAANTNLSLANLYRADNRPWVVAFSGGKDSTTVLQLVFEMLLDFGKKANKPVIVISSDTQLEAPNVAGFVTATLHRIEKAAKALDLPLSVRVVCPLPEESFWGKLIGRGYPPPSKWFRWCTSNMKIKPSRRAIEELTRTCGSCQSASKIDPPSACKIDPPQTVVFSW